MATDLFKGPLFNLGEGLDENDLNHLRGNAEARLFDQLLEHLAGALASGAKDPDLWAGNGADVDLTSLIYTMTGGDAVLKQGTTAVKVSCGGGTIFQKVTAATGDEPTFLPYQLAPGEFDLTIGAGDATNPRIDIVQVKLEWVQLVADQETRSFEDATTRAKTSTTPVKKRRVQATVSLKAGTYTGGATPTFPAPDSGYAVLGAVRVPATWTTGTTPDGTGSSSAGLRQCSIPLRIDVVTTPAADMIASDADWTYNSLTGSYVSGGTATNLIAYCPAGGHGKRIVGVAIIAKFNTSGAVRLRNAPRTTLGPSVAAVPVNDLSATLVNADGTMRLYFAHLGVIADASSDSNPSAANGPIGDAFWCCGGKGGPTHRPFELGSVPLASGGLRSALDIDGGNTSQVMEVIWYLAG